MKESRYIELLNLYVDHQLTPAEAAELETEVQRNPDRRRVYSQYCRMQKACTLLFEAERSLAPKTAAVVVAFDSRGTTRSETTPFWAWGGIRVAGLAAALACAAIFGVRFMSTSSVMSPGGLESGTSASLGSPDVAQMSLASTQIITPVAEQTVVVAPAAPGAPIAAPAPGRSQFQSVLIGTTLVMSRLPVGESSSASAVDLGWLNQVKVPALRSLPEDDLAFEAVPTLKQPETRVYRSRQPFQGSGEMISFQFQR